MSFTKQRDFNVQPTNIMSDVLKKDKKSKDGVSKPSKKDSNKDESAKKQRKEAAAKAFTLLADEKAVDPTLSSLFSVRVRRVVLGSVVASVLTVV